MTNRNLSKRLKLEDNIAYYYNLITSKMLINMILK